MADESKIRQAEDELIEGLSKPKQYTNDGESVVRHTPAEQIEAIRFARRSAVSIQNAFGCVGGVKISTQGPEK